MITGTTVGFGDKSPREQGVRLASVFFLPLAVAVLGEFLGRVAGAYVGRKRRLAEKKFFEHSLTLADIRIMDSKLLFLSPLVTIEGVSLYGTNSFILVQRNCQVFLHALGCITILSF